MGTGSEWHNEIVQQLECNPHAKVNVQLLQQFGIVPKRSAKTHEQVQQQHVDDKGGSGLNRSYPGVSDQLAPAPVIVEARSAASRRSTLAQKDEVLENTQGEKIRLPVKEVKQTPRKTSRSMITIPRANRTTTKAKGPKNR